MWTPITREMGTDSVSPNWSLVSSSARSIRDGDSQVVVACSNVRATRRRLNRDRVGGAGVKNSATDEKCNGRYFSQKGCKYRSMF